jgi:hypothetical protein
LFNDLCSKLQKTAARGSPPAAIGICYNRICSLPETCVLKIGYIIQIRIEELVGRTVPRSLAEAAAKEASGG